MEALLQRIVDTDSNSYDKVRVSLQGQEEPKLASIWMSR